jgi:hypothetical protein
VLDLSIPTNEYSSIVPLFTTFVNNGALKEVFHEGIFSDV